jgi:hypothetical protein
MSVQADTLLSTVAQELHISEEDLVKQGVHSLLKCQLREIKAEIFAIHGRYSVSSVEEMEARYQDGTLEEADSLRDLQRLRPLGVQERPPTATLRGGEVRIYKEERA